MFVIEGLPAVLVGVWCLFALADRPSDAQGLTGREKNWLESPLAEEAAHIHANHSSSGFLRADIRVLTLSFIYFCMKFGSYARTFFLPLMIVAVQNQSGTKMSTLEVGLMVAIPSALAIPGAIFWARHSDKTGERFWHSTIPSVLGALGILRISRP